MRLPNWANSASLRHSARWGGRRRRRASSSASRWTPCGPAARSGACSLATTRRRMSPSGYRRRRAEGPSSVSWARSRVSKFTQTFYITEVGPSVFPRCFCILGAPGRPKLVILELAQAAAGTHTRRHGGGTLRFALRSWAPSRLVGNLSSLWFHVYSWAAPSCPRRQSWHPPHPQALRENRFREEDAGCAFTEDQARKMHDDARAFTSLRVKEAMGPDERLSAAKRRSVIPRLVFRDSLGPGLAGMPLVRVLVRC